MKHLKQFNHFLNESGMEPHKELIFVPEKYYNLRGALCDDHGMASIKDIIEEFNEISQGMDMDLIGYADENFIGVDKGKEFKSTPNNIFIQLDDSYED